MLFHKGSTSTRPKTVALGSFVEKLLSSIDENRTMNTVKQSFLAMAVGVALALGWTVKTAAKAAQDTSTARECTNATLTGAYAYEIIGQDGTQAPFLPFAAVRLVQFDGQGMLQGSGFRVLAGVTAQTTVAGTYQVMPDCTVNFDIGVFKTDGTKVDQDTLFGVIVEQGEKVRALITNSEIPGTNSVLFERVTGKSQK
jgi:hypothetical protein